MLKTKQQSLWTRNFAYRNFFKEIIMYVCKILLHNSILSTIKNEMSSDKILVKSYDIYIE